ncbi:hypothetical protein BDZ89DRAFT_1065404 [Hymenopellis radicata]|nr:hypothetical protein BDZ89DRAFT_1065404 [Hymenopellis radicata]
MSSLSTKVSSAPRTLVLCFDGTSNEYNEQNTNVVKFFSILHKDDDKQLCYYQAGIGTFFAPGVVSPLLEWFAKVADEAIAWYLSAHNYRAGDKICIFGFSRGAYTARALAGMLYKVGLLPRDNEEQVPFAYRLYTREDENGVRLSAGFKRTFCRNVQIEFMGVWDTVSSVGVVMGRTLPFTTSNKSIKTFRHALSLDEHRARFKPNLYHRPAPGEYTTGDILRNKPSSAGRKPFPLFNKFKRSKFGVQAESSDDDGWNPTMSWKYGSQMSVVAKMPNDAPNSLSKCILTMDGPPGDPVAVRNHFCRVRVRDAQAYPCASLLMPTNGVAEKTVMNDVDAVDALQPLHDPLQYQKLWWILEVLPTKYTWQDADCVWHSHFGWNLGRGRTILEKEPKFHITVQARMKDLKLAYKPKATWDSKETYVV